MNHCLMLYHRLNSDDCIKTAIKTLKKHSNCEIHVYSDTSEYETVHKTNNLKNRIAFSKLEATLDLMNQIEGNLMVADVDLYFLADPFSVFKKDFDLAYTTRHYKFSYPVNGGVYFFKVNDDTKALAQYNIDQALNPTWPKYKRFKIERFGLNWSVGQAFLNACHAEKERIQYKFDVKLLDVGPEYNFCPHNKSLGFEAAEQELKEAINKVKILHLKGGLKQCLYNEWLREAVTDEYTNKWY